MISGSVCQGEELLSLTYWIPEKIVFHRESGEVIDKAQKIAYTNYE